MASRELKIVIEDLRSVPLTEKPLGAEPLLIGSDLECDISLATEISPRHARIESRQGVPTIESVSSGETLVNGQRLPPDRAIPLEAGDVISVHGFRLKIVSPGEGARSPRRSLELMRRFSDLKARLHRELIEQADLPSLTSARLEEQLGTKKWKDRIHEALDALLSRRQDLDAELSAFIVGEAFFQALMDQLIQDRAAADSGRLWTAHPSSRRFLDLVEKSAAQLMAGHSEKVGVPEIDLKVSDRIRAVHDGFDEVYELQRPYMDGELCRYVVRETLRRDLQDLVFGLGPLQDLLRMPDLSEIMVIGRDKIFVDKAGQLEETGRSFPGDDSLQVAIKRIVDPIGRSINLAEPIVDARLDDGSRVNIVIQPISILGPSITIRKFRETPFTADELVRNRTLTRRVRLFLEGCVRSRKNIIISGGTSSGKTTLLNTLSRFIPEGERIVVIEDSHELQLQQPNLVFLEARRANLEGKGRIAIRDLVRTSLRMRPDRIVVGECRGAEALDMLQAMNTGHDGSLTTAHANSPREMISRLEVMVLEAEEGLPIPAVHRQITGAIDLIVQIERLRGGARRVTRVTEIVGFDSDEGRIVLEDIFRLPTRRGADAKLRFTGYLPTFIDEFESKAEVSIEELFFERRREEKLPESRRPHPTGSAEGGIG